MSDEVSDGASSAGLASAFGASSLAFVSAFGASSLAFGASSFFFGASSLALASTFGASSLALASAFGASSFALASVFGASSFALASVFGAAFSASFFGTGGIYGFSPLAPLIAFLSTDSFTPSGSGNASLTLGPGCFETDLSSAFLKRNGFSSFLA